MALLMWLGQQVKVNGKNYVVKELEDEPKNKKSTKGAYLYCKKDKKDIIHIPYSVIDGANNVLG